MAEDGTSEEARPHQPFIANAFAIVGFIRVAPRDSGRQLSTAIELKDPDILFFYPLHDEESRTILREMVQFDFFRPDGYRLLAAETAEQPLFNMYTLVKKGYRKHVAVLTFQEANNNGCVFLPKFLVFISDNNVPDFFERCLCYFYNAFFVHRTDVKYLNMTLASLVCNVRLPCCSQDTVTCVKFKIPPGHDDDDALIIGAQSPKLLPEMGVRVYRLFYQLGITFAVDAVLSLLNEMKVVAFSHDVTLLTDCCKALIALLWPLSYNNVYSPVVHKRILTDLLKSQRAFFVGTTNLTDEEKLAILEQDRAVLIDLDQRVVVMSEKVMDELVDFEDSVKDQLFKDLTIIYSGKDVIEDWNNNGTCETGNDNKNLLHAKSVAKQIQACFLRLFATMFSSYRRSMAVVRFFNDKGRPQPAFFFDVANFLDEHGLEPSQRGLFLKMVNAGLIEDFFQQRFFPFRKVDFFDELCATFGNILTETSAVSNECHRNRNIINQIVVMTTEAGQPADDEHDKSSCGTLTFESSSATFPQPDSAQILKHKTNNRDEEMVFIEVTHRSYQDDSKRVPIGIPIVRKTKGGLSSKEWEFLVKSLDVVFSTGITPREEKILKSLKWVKCSSDRRRFCLELSRRAAAKSSLLDQRSFECIVTLAAELSETESQLDENGIACALLGALSNISCQSSSSHKTEFLHRKVQCFRVWWNESLWLRWLNRFIASELVAKYNGQKPEIEKEPGRSMELITDLIWSSQQGAKKVYEESVVVQCCLACIDLMLSYLLRCNKLENNGNNCIITLITSVITKMAIATRLTNSQTQQLVDGIIEKFAINEDYF